MPLEEVERRQQVLDRERQKFLYQTVPPMERSQLVDLLVSKMCASA